MKKEPLQILTTPMGDDGCAWYRCKLWAETLVRAGEIEIFSVTKEMDLQTTMLAVEHADLLYFRFWDGRGPGLMQLIKKKYPNKPMIFDDDDDSHTISPLNRAYRTWGLEEVMLEDGTIFWKQGENGFDKFRNRKMLIDYEACLETADVLTTTTPRLAAKFANYNDNVVVLPNALNLSYFPQLQLPSTGRTKLLWQGGESHFEDLEEVIDGLKFVLERNPDVEFHVVGVEDSFHGTLKRLPQNRVFTYPWVSVDGHGYRLATLGAHIGIAPLEDRPFNAMKSCLKFYEYGALGIPTVASNVAPYMDEIKHKETGILANAKDFGGAIQELLNDPIMRVSLGKNAHDWVEANRNIESVAQDWLELFTRLVEASRKVTNGHVQGRGSSGAPSTTNS